MELITLFYDHVFSQIPQEVFRFGEFTGAVLFAIYFIKRLTTIDKKIDQGSITMAQSVDMLKQELDDSVQDIEKKILTHQEVVSKEYAKQSETRQIWDRINKMSDDINNNMKVGFEAVNMQISNLSAAIISAVSHK